MRSNVITQGQNTFSTRHIARCCDPVDRWFFWTVIGARHGREGRVERFIHRHYPDGFVLPVHYDTVPD